MKFTDENGVEWKECARFSSECYRNIEKPKHGYEYVTVHRLIPEQKQEWKISHPGTGESLTCGTFYECMNKWFEGFNVPVLVTNGVPEDFPTSYARVKEYFKDKRK